MLKEQTNTHLTAPVVARIFGITPQAVYNWLAEGRFPHAVRLDTDGRNPFVIPRADVEAAIAERVAELRAEIARLRAELAATN